MVMKFPVSQHCKMCNKVDFPLKTDMPIVLQLMLDSKCTVKPDDSIMTETISTEKSKCKNVTVTVAAQETKPDEPIRIRMKYDLHSLDSGKCECVTIRDV